MLEKYHARSVIFQFVQFFFKETTEIPMASFFFHHSVVLYYIPLSFLVTIRSKVRANIVFVGYGISTSFWGILSWQEHGSFCKKRGNDGMYFATNTNSNYRQEAKSHFAWFAGFYAYSVEMEKFNMYCLR